MPDKSFFKDKKDKEWFANFFYYYKLHMVSIGVMIFFVAIGAVQCAQSVRYDLSVIIGGDVPINDVQLDELADIFSQYLDDGNSDSSAAVNVTTMADRQQLFLEMGAGESYLYLMPHEIFRIFENENQFIDISDLIGADVPTYGISYRPYPDAEVLHAGVRIIAKENVENEVDIMRQNNAKKVLRMMFESQSTVIES